MIPNEEEGFLIECYHLRLIIHDILSYFNSLSECINIFVFDK